MLKSAEFQEVLSLALELSPSERIAMIEELAASFRQDPEPADEAPLTPEEITAMMRVEPLPPAQVVAQGLLGTWAHLGITDGAEWVNAQKRKRKARRKW
jgi:hypothetical protein